MAAYDDLRNDTTIATWLKRIDKTPKTERTYLMGMCMYISFTKMSAAELLDEAKREEKEGVDTDDKAIVRRRYDFRAELKKMVSEKTRKKLSPNSILTMMRGVDSFYRAFHLSVPELLGRKTAESQEENTQFITKEEIYEVLKIATPVEKAIILTQCSSGLAEADIINLKIKDFKRGYDPETKIAVLKDHIRYKTKIKHTTFISPEASEATLDYLKFREREPVDKSETRLKETAKQRIISEDGYLFIKQQIPKAYKLDHSPAEAKKMEELRKYNEDAITHMFRRLAEKTQKINPHGWNIVRSHNMRKFFNNTLRNAGFDYAQIEHMMGHKVSGNEKAYTKYNLETLRKTYELAIPYLTIDKSRVSVDEESYKKALAELQNERDTYKAVAADTIVERYEWQEFQKKYENEIQKMKKELELYSKNKLEGKLDDLDIGIRMKLDDEFRQLLQANVKKDEKDYFHFK